MMRRFLVRLIFNEYERALIEEAVLDYTDYPDDVVAEHAGSNWYLTQQEMVEKIAKVMS